MKKTLIYLLLSFLPYWSYSQDAGLEWAVQTENPGEFFYPQSMSIDASGNVISAGLFQLTIDFDPGPGIDTLVGNANVGGFTNMKDGFIRKLDKDGNFVWVKHLISDEALQIEKTHIDPSGKIYICGYFSGNLDLDPGTDSFLVTSVDRNTDIFVLILDSNGNFHRGFSLPGGGEDRSHIITTDEDGNVYLGGSFSFDLDFDPDTSSSYILNATYHGENELFILKLDPNLDFQWVRYMPYIGSDFYNSSTPIALEIAPSGNIYTLARFSGRIDVDPGSAVVQLQTQRSINNTYIHKMDQGGNFVWAKQVHSIRSIWASEMIIDSAENITHTGDFDFEVQLDPMGMIPPISTAHRSAYIQRLDSNGVYVWGNALVGTNNPEVRPHVGGLSSDAKGNLYVSGSFKGTIDFDLGLGQFNLTAGPLFASRATFISKYRSDGNFVWAQRLDETIATGNKSLVVDKEGNIYHSNLLPNSVDFDPGPGLFELSSIGRPDMFTFKWNQSCNDMTLILDEIRDVSCDSLGKGIAHVEGGTPPFAYSWSNMPQVDDSSTFFTLPGIYTLTATDSFACTRITNFLVGGKDFTQNLGLTTNLTTTEFRPGFPTTIWLDAFNGTCTPFTGELVLVLDPVVQFDSASIPPDRMSGDSLIWNLSNITFDSGHFLVSVEVNTPLSSSIGDRLCFDLSIPRKGTSSNTKIRPPRNYCFDVVNSYDPNDKQVYPQGNCTSNYVKKDESLTYTVRFQNTGTADAINIFILDTLNTHFEIDSLIIVGQSHEPMITEILENNVLKFSFNNIHLPDSNTNEKLSHGYVMFEIKPRDNVGNLISIENRAAIYFDFNDPIITNSVRNTLIDDLPLIDTTQLQISSCGEFVLNDKIYEESGIYFQKLRDSWGCDSIIEIDLNIYPVSTIDTTISVVGGVLMANEQGASYQWIDCNNMGEYIVGANSQTFTPDENGTYAVIIDNGVCSYTSSCINMTRVSVNEEFLSSLSYYPNPTNGSVEINLNTTYTDIEVRIKNVLGQSEKVQSFHHSSKITLELPSGSGIFLIHLLVDGKRGVLKVLKN